MDYPFNIRHYVPERDLSSLSLLLTEIESIDHDGEDASEEYLRASLVWPNYRPEQDVWIAEWEGRPTGYGVALEQPSQRCTIYVVVHPSQRRKGLGSRLLDLTLHRARELDTKNVLAYANEHNNGSNAFLTHHKFQQVGSSGAMKASSIVEVPPFKFPAGFTLKRYSEVHDSSVLLSALRDCYLDMWGHQYHDQPTAEDLQSPPFLKYYDANNILMLFDPNNKVCGFCSVKPEGKIGEDGSLSDLLDGPGIVQEYREQGYQRQLVLAGMGHLRQKRTRAITLEFWGDKENTLDIYRSIGFEMVNRHVAYHKELE